jgi:hypothetical protein
MTPLLMLVVPAVASGIGLPTLDASGQTVGYLAAIQHFAGQTATALASGETAGSDVAGVAYLTCLFAAVVLLYFAHTGRWWAGDNDGGRDGTTLGDAHATSSRDVSAGPTSRWPGAPSTGRT